MGGHDLIKGENDVAFIDVSGHIQPETALLKSSGGKLDVLEQNFDFDLLTPEKLLEKSVGGTVRVIVTDPKTGKETVEEAKVLSVANGVVLQIGDRIETQAPGRIVFAEVPPTALASQPGHQDQQRHGGQAAGGTRLSDGRAFLGGGLRRRTGAR
jgi:hypothetical protein